MDELDMWEEVFSQKYGHYQANLFPSVNKASKVTLSLYPLTLQQQSLLFQTDRTNAKSPICLKNILLSRLLKQLGTEQPDYILQMLFGYPFLRFCPQVTKEYLSLLTHIDPKPSSESSSQRSSKIILCRQFLNKKILHLQ